MGVTALPLRTVSLCQSVDWNTTSLVVRNAQPAGADCRVERADRCDPSRVGLTLAGVAERDEQLPCTTASVMGGVPAVAWLCLSELQRNELCDELLRQAFVQHCCSTAERVVA